MNKLGLILYINILSLSFSLFVFGQTEVEKKQSVKNQTGFRSLLISEVKNAEFAEVLNTSSLVSKVSNEEYTCRVFSCSNGPGNPDIEACSSSVNYYISNGKHTTPSEFRLFKVGPFYEVINATLVPGPTVESYILTIQHSHGTKRLVSKYILSFGKVTGWNG